METVTERIEGESKNRIDEEKYYKITLWWGVFMQPLLSEVIIMLKWEIK